MAKLKNVNELKTTKMNYRIGRKTGLVILTTKDSKEVATCRTVDIASKICRLLNKEEQVNVTLGSVSNCPHKECIFIEEDYHKCEGCEELD